MNKTKKKNNKYVMFPLVMGLLGLIAELTVTLSFHTESPINWGGLLPESIPFVVLIILIEFGLFVVYDIIFELAMLILGKIAGNDEFVYRVCRWSAVISEGVVLIALTYGLYDTSNLTYLVICGVISILLDITFTLLLLIHYAWGVRNEVKASVKKDKEVTDTDAGLEMVDLENSEE